jgi:hypothetical protein
MPTETKQIDARTLAAHAHGLKDSHFDYSPAEGKECNELFCGGRLGKRNPTAACVFGTSAAETGFKVDVYECGECGAEYYD